MGRGVGQAEGPDKVSALYPYLEQGVYSRWPHRHRSTFPIATAAPTATRRPTPVAPCVLLRRGDAVVPVPPKHQCIDGQRPQTRLHGAKDR